MRVTVTIIAISALTVLGACGDDEEESAGEVEVSGGAPGSLPALPSAAVMSHLGGFIVPAQEYHVELLPKSDGKVEAVVMDAQGALVGAAAGLTLSVKLTGSDGGQHDVDMIWDAGRERWVGRMDVEGGVTIETGPAEVTVNAGGEAHAGAAASVQVAAPAVHGGAVVLAGDYSVELVPMDGEVLAYVVDANGARVTAAADVELKIRVGAEAAAREVDLAWDAEAGAFKAAIEGGVDVNVQPVGVFFTSGGALHRGRIVHVRRGLAGSVNAAAGAGVDVQAPSGDVNVQAGARGTGVNVQGARGRVSVMATGPNVRVATPSAMVSVRGRVPSGMVSAMTGGGIRVGSGGVSAGGVMVSTMRPRGMASAMAGVSIGGGGGIRIGN